MAFDFDGVILESAEVKTRAFLELFSQYPQHREAILEHHLAHLGVSRFEKFAWIYRVLLGRHLSDAERERLGREYSRLVLADVLAAPFVPGARELLEELAGRVSTHVVSATPQGELEEILRRRRLEALFDTVHGSPPAKPEALRRILAAFDLSPDRLLVIGDGVSDLDAARAVGAGFVARLPPDAPVQKWPDGVARIFDLDELRRQWGLG